MNGEKVRFRVENEAVDAERLLIVAEQQIKILERFAQEKGFHHVPQLDFRDAAHVP